MQAGTLTLLTVCTGIATNTNKSVQSATLTQTSASWAVVIEMVNNSFHSSAWNENIKY